MKTAAGLGAIAAMGSMSIYKGFESMNMFGSKKMSPEEGQYQDYLAKQGKTYNTKDEYNFRLEEFKISKRHVDSHNSQDQTHKAGYNEFSDWTTEEY